MTNPASNCRGALVRTVLLAASCALVALACDESTPLPTVNARDTDRGGDEERGNANDSGRVIPDAGADDNGPADVAPDPSALADTASDTSPSDGGVFPSPDVEDDSGGDDAPVDPAPDVPEVAPPNCGDGVVNVDEQCDDANDDDTDECTNICTIARCGDGRLNSTFGVERFTDPVAENPFGQSGRICDDGTTCPVGEGCSLEEDGWAPEHGICQALGYEYTTDVVWVGGEDTTPVTPVVHVYDWECFDFYCYESGFGGEGGSCGNYELLAEIECAGIVGEECDSGARNVDGPDTCRTDCTLPRCGDAILDTDEECDDGNRVNDDACSNACVEAVCGDGIVQADEECDDGNTRDDDSCSNTCESDVPTCVDFDIGSAIGSSVLTGTTVGRSSAASATCGGGAGSPEVAVGWVAPRSGAFTFDLAGSSYDTVLHIRDGSTGVCTGPELGCNDDAVGLQSSVAVTVSAGQILVIYIDGFSSGSVGTFVLNISG